MIHNNHITEDLLRLYELSLATGNGKSPLDTCAHFLKTLVTRYNLTGASIWWRHKDKQLLQPIAVLPNIHKERFDQNLAVLVGRSLDENTEFLGDSELAKQISGYFDTHDLAIAICPIADTGALLIHTACQDVLTRRALTSLHPVLRALGTTLQGEFATEALAQSQRLLSEQRGFLKTLFQRLPDLIWLKNPDGTYLACNRRFEQLVGALEQDVVGKTDYHFFEHQQSSEFRHQDIKAMFSDTPLVNEVCVTFAGDGHQEQLEVTRVKMHNDDGKVVGVLGLGHDITGRLLSETKLRNSEASFRSLFESVQEAVYVQDKNGNFIAVNDGAAKMHGREKTWFEGKSPLDLAAREKNDTVDLQLMLDKVLEGKPQSFECWELRANGQAFPKEVHQTLGSWFGKSAVFTVATDISERKQAAQQLEHWAKYDELTDLPNRRYLLEYLRKVNYRSHRHHHIAALLFIDLDNFKHVNDTHGHLIGDGLLKSVGQRLAAMVQGDDMAARLGGDEYVFLLTDLSNDTNKAIEQVQRSAEKIQQGLSGPYHLGEHILYITCSIGISMIPMENEDAYDILKHADTAMYYAKETCRNTVHFYSPSMQLAAEVRLKMQNELQEAILKEAFELHFQPQISADMKLVGAEAILFMQHPEKGPIAPMNFIHVAQQSGQILPMGDWVLNNALLQIQQWSKAFTDPAFQRLSINISQQEFVQHDFIQRLQDALEEASVDPGLLTLELSEKILIDNLDYSVERLAVLKDLGVKLSMDDFGSGYSSLSYLKRLPLDELKIDQSFVQGLNTDDSDANLVRTVVSMAKALNLTVVFEGIDTEEELQFLKEHGCTIFQGYWVGKPMAIDRYEHWQKNTDWVVRH